MLGALSNFLSFDSLVGVSRKLSHQSLAGWLNTVTATMADLGCPDLIVNPRPRPECKAINMLLDVKSKCSAPSDRHSRAGTLESSVLLAYVWVCLSSGSILD